MPDAEDVGTALGCLGCTGVILFKIALFAVAAYVIYHFVAKYW